MNISLKRRLSLLLSLCLVVTSISYLGFAESNDEEALPETYDLREEGRLTEVKAQGNMGSCWAVSSMASLESFLMTQENKVFDLSEANLMMMTSDTYNKGFDRKFYYGGDPAIATAYYASWNGPVAEADHPYPLTGRREDFEVIAASNVVKHVQDVIFVDKPESPLKNEDIKRFIMKYGAVDAAMWKGTPQTFGKYFDQENFAWYYPSNQPNQEGNGHAIDIVGWDDNFSKDNFAIKPPGDGAYIARNTKGPKWGSPDQSVNMGGYFYISYYDGMLFDPNDSLVGGAVFTRVDDVDNYDNIYQYDELGYTGHLASKKNEVTFANVFNVNESADETLKALSFYTLNNNLKYEIYIKDGYESVDDLYNAKPYQKGEIKYKGYHTIDLEIPKRIFNTNVAVMVKLTSLYEKPLVAMEYPDGLLSSRATHDGLSFVNLNQIFEPSSKYKNNSNVCLKMFTDGAKNVSTEVSPSNMKKDIDFLVEWIKGHQPNVKLDGYTDEQLATIQRVRENTQESLSRDEFYLEINQLFTMLNDGHSTLFYQFQDKRRVPIHFKWLNDGIFVTESTKELKVGDRILQIGGKTPEELEVLLKKQISSENKYHIRNEAPTKLINWPILENLGLVSEFGKLNVLIERDKEIIAVSLYPQYDFTVDSTYNEVTSDWILDKDNNLAIFRFDVFANGEKFEEMAGRMDYFFELVDNEGIDNVAIDLRNNGGGTAQMLNQLLAHILTGDEVVYASGDINYDVYKQYKKQWMKEFHGDVYVLTSNYTFSCAVLATTILQDNGLAKVIGEPTGENPAFNRHGSGSDGSLPSSGWRFMMTSNTADRPHFKDPTVDSNYPDIPVYTSIDNIINGVDAQIEALKEITNPSYQCYQKPLEFDFGEAYLPVNDLPNGKNYSIGMSARIKSIDEKKYISCNVIKDKGKLFISLPQDLRIDQRYELLINDLPIVDKYYFNFGHASDEVSYNGIKHVSYVKKWDYFIIDTDTQWIKSIDFLKIDARDVNGNSVRINSHEVSWSYDNLHLLLVSQDPASGIGVIEFKPGALQYLNGEQNENSIYMKYKVD